MVEPVGAMAMFVLRLAGLLSLENAIKEQEANLTHQALNFTSLGFTPDTSNYTWSSPQVQPPKVNSTTPSSDDSELPSMAASQLGVTTPASVDNFLNPTPTVVSHYINIKQPPKINESPNYASAAPGTFTSYNRKNIVDGDITDDSIELLPRASPLSDTRDFNEGSDIQPYGSQPVEHTELQVRKPEEEAGGREREEIVVQKVQGSVKSSADSGEDGRGGTLMGPGEDSPAFVRIQIDTGEDPRAAEGTLRISVVTYSPGPEDFPQVDRGAVRGGDLVTLSSAVTTSTPTPMPTLPPTLSPPTLPPTPTPPTLPPTPTSPTQSHPRLEALIEEDDVSGLIDAPKLAGLEAPSENFVDSDFEYYDFGTQYQTMTPNPTLSSLSLVSAVPVRVPARPPEPRRKPQMRKPAPGRPRKVPPVRPIPPIPPVPPAQPQRPVVRNNPYPYGPLRLPGPYSPIGPNLPPTRDTSEERVVTEYNYEEDYYYDLEDNVEAKYEVQTKEPPVLFVFDRPGYSPEPPTTMVPPTRAPTPSDPWDCSPRCPRYTLIDWNMDYDVRMYPETLWVSTIMISDNRVLAELEGYMRIQDYFYGLNDQGMVLNLTVPFVTQIKYGKHPGVLAETNDYTVSLYVQPTYYENMEIPTPISNEVLVDELETKTVFVHSFEANVWDVTESFLEEKVQTLMEQLRHNGEAFLDRYYYLASYSRPELYQTVYYEIWIYATNFRDPQTTSKSTSYNRRPQTNKITQKTLNKLCRGVECPKFEVLRTYKYGIQKRRYYHGLFASTSSTECQFTTMSVWKGFMPLHLYKHGVNSHMEVIEATRPIALVHILDSTDPNTECPQNLTMSLYLPHRLHSNPPITGYAAPNVHITALDDVIVYAYTVGGYLLDPGRVRKELSDMKYRLSEFGACYKDDEHYVVIYDFIVRYHGRQNEIWVVAENCKATHNG
ncbi:uncharacterized protein LOC121862125 [Homarus americanus]|uniref:Heme-binding protein 2-like 1 n=1 Tax=Homarus americanus TaxID=6706 RepID=A0A8J5N2Y4_HOMAM|nr:uncharacterized protein LOC121862125 [Homarus americanus]XP_042216063.1 uncharacterized protein LOC121862125 [Homarus americanus]XP_042216064.1 uncharacterized protein LOC121862125 [Homarus americanus]KAG7172256.1 Heme-binding protein 2-like 1 [Homarus americanus]